MRTSTYLPLDEIKRVIDVELSKVPAMLQLQGHVVEEDEDHDGDNVLRLYLFLTEEMANHPPDDAVREFVKIVPTLNRVLHNAGEPRFLHMRLTTRDTFDRRFQLDDEE